MLEDHVRQSLSAAGIGKAYHDRKLSEFKELKTIAEALFDTSANAYLLEGKGWSIVGDSARAREAFMVLARSTHITGTSVLVTDLVDMVETLNSGEIGVRQVIFVGGFYEPGPPVLTPYQARLASRTMLEWMEEGGVIVPHIASNEKPPALDAWWRPHLIEALAKRNETIAVGGRA